MRDSWHVGRGQWLLIDRSHWSWQAMSEAALEGSPDFPGELVSLDVMDDGDPQRQSGNYLPLTEDVGLVLIPPAAWAQVTLFAADCELTIESVPWLQMDEEAVYVLRPEPKD